MVRESEAPQDLQSPSWRLRKANFVLPNPVQVIVQKQEKTKFQLKDKVRQKFPVRQRE